PLSRRHELHRALARALARTGAPFEEIAGHLHVVGPRGDEWVATTLHAAAASARDAGAWDAATALLRRALAEGATADCRARVLADLARAEAVAGDVAAAAHAECALGLVAAPGARADLLDDVGRALLVAGHVEVAARLFERGLAQGADVHRHG